MGADEDRIQYLKEKLFALREVVPETPLDAEKKAMEIDVLEEELSELYQKGAPVYVKPTTETEDDLTEQIASITDELMEIEIKMLKAEMRNDEDERIKLQMCTSALKARRQELVDEVKGLNKAQPVKKDESDHEARILALEKEVADLKSLLYNYITGNSP